MFLYVVCIIETNVNQHTYSYLEGKRSGEREREKEREEVYICIYAWVRGETEIERIMKAFM